MKLSRLLFASALASFSAHALAFTVLVAHPIATGVAEDLLKDTNSTVLNAVPKSTPANRQAHYMESQGKEELAEMARKSDAVVTVRSVFAQEHLYPYARRSNIRIVPIDIAVPIDGDNSGVAIVDEPLDQHQVWLNPNNLQVMYELFAVEVGALEPKIKAKVDANLEAKVKEIRDLLLDANEFLGSLSEEPAMLVMNPELGYLAQGLEMHAVDSEIPPAGPERDALVKSIKNFNVKVAVNTKKISDEDKAFLDENGVKFVRVTRLKPEDPLGQLKALYDAIKEAVKS